MEIILLQDIKNYGRKGDLKTAKDGYARNYLIPKGFAKPATKELQDKLTAEKIELGKHGVLIKKMLIEIQNSTAETPLVFRVKVGEKGEVFGSLRADDIKKQLVSKYKLEPDHLDVKKDHIKELGKHIIPINLGQGIEGEILIDIHPVSNRTSKMSDSRL